MMKILISAPYLIKEIDEYEPLLKKEGLDIIIANVEERLEEEELLKYMEDIDGVICGDDKFTQKVIDGAKKLKVIVKWGTGIDSIDKKYAESRGIKVYNTPNAFSEPVSDTVMAYILAFSRKILKLDNMMKEGKWEKIQSYSLTEKSIGIIGVGNVGTALARKASVFNMKIFGNDIKEIPKELQRKYGIEMVELKTLLKKSDFVSINCDFNPTSYHLIDYDKIRMMKKSSFLINTARGPIINEVDLIKALKEGIIKGAALDVFEDEPLPLNSPLREMENVFLSPHNSNSSPKYWKKVHKNSIKMLIKGLRR